MKKGICINGVTLRVWKRKAMPSAQSEPRMFEVRASRKSKAIWPGEPRMLMPQMSATIVTKTIVTAERTSAARP